MRFQCMSLLITSLCAPAFSFSYMESLGNGAKPVSRASSGPQRKDFSPSSASWKTKSSSPTTGNLANEPDSGPSSVVSADTEAVTPSAPAVPPTSTSAGLSSPATTAEPTPQFPYMKKSKYMYSPKITKPAQQQPSSGASPDPIVSPSDGGLPGMASASHMDATPPPSVAKKSSYMYSPKTANPVQKSASYLDNMSSTLGDLGTAEPVGYSTSQSPTTPSQPAGAGAGLPSYTDILSPPGEVKKSSYMYSPKTAKPVAQSSSYLDNMSPSLATFELPEPAVSGSSLLTDPSQDATVASGLSYLENLSPPSAAKKSLYMYSPKTAKPTTQSSSYLDNIPATLDDLGSPEPVDYATSQSPTTPSQPAAGAGAGLPSYTDNLSPPSAVKKSSYMYSPKIAKPTTQSSSYLDNIPSTLDDLGSAEPVDYATGQSPTTPSQPAAGAGAGAGLPSYTDSLSPPNAVKKSSYMYSPKTSKPLQQSPSSYLETVSSSSAAAPESPATLPASGPSSTAATSASYMDALSPPSIQTKKSSYMYSPKKQSNVPPKSEASSDMEVPEEPTVEDPTPPPQPPEQPAQPAQPADAQLSRSVRKVRPGDRLVRRVTRQEIEARKRFGRGVTAKDALRLLTESPPKNNKPGWFSVPPDNFL